jgi:hypothetical protein
MPTKRKKKTTALARRRPTVPSRRRDIDDGTPMGIAQRLARDPKLTVEKLERLIALNERMMAAQAESAYWAAYDAMVLELPIIEKNGKIYGKSEVKGQRGPLQSRYSKFEDIQHVIKPILKRFGFVTSYKTEWPAPAVLCVVGRLKHNAGHYEESRFQSPADNTGGKNAIQGLGSANSYGKRYTIVDLLNLEQRGKDDDGNAAGELEPEQPRGRGRRQKADSEVIDVPASEPLHAHHSESKEPITEKQLDRLKAIIRSSGRIDRDVKLWIGHTYQIKKLSEIRRCDYDAIVAAVESPKNLPAPPAREPGSDDE